MTRAAVPVAKAATWNRSTIRLKWKTLVTYTYACNGVRMHLCACEQNACMCVYVSQKITKTIMMKNKAPPTAIPIISPVPIPATAQHTR